MYRYQSTKKVTPIARVLRRKQTDAERVLWFCLRDRQLGGYKFRRQFPLGKYVLDFYCLEMKRAVELDGSQHMEELQRVRDEQRTKYFESHGIRIIRFWDTDVVHNIEGVCETILQSLKTSPNLSYKERRTSDPTSVLS